MCIYLFFCILELDGGKYSKHVCGEDPQGQRVYYQEYNSFVAQKGGGFILTVKNSSELNPKGTLTPELFLNGPALYPPPPFFAASLSLDIINILIKY